MRQLVITLLQCGRVVADAESCPSRGYRLPEQSFNVAASSPTRNRQAADAARALAIAASMWPRRRRRGIAPARRRSSRR